MGGGNGQKAKMARERNMEKNKPAKGTINSFSSHLFPVPFLAFSILFIFLILLHHTINDAITFFFFFYYFVFLINDHQSLSIMNLVGRLGGTEGKKAKNGTGKIWRFFPQLASTNAIA